jgi:copper transport protein
MKRSANDRRRTSRLTRVLQGLPLLLLGVLTFAPVAVDAHALLVASSPAAGQRIDATLQSITLTFDGPVEAGLSSIRVLDSAGAERGAGPPIHPAAAPQTLTMRTAPLRHGQFIVAWRVVSADSHLVSGAFAFGVGETAGEVPPALAHPPEPGLPLLMAILHIGEIGSLLMAIGLTIASIAVPRCQARSAPITRGAWIALSAIAFVQFFGQSEAIGVVPLRLLETRLGALRIALVLGGILGCVALRVSSRMLLVAAALTVVGGDVFSGHAVTGAAPVLGVIVESIHLVAAAAWLGVLIVALDAPSTHDLERIGAVAAASVLALALTALPQGLQNIAAAQDLGTTVYGRLVCVKVGLFTVTLAVAALSRWRSRRHSPRLGASVKVEIALLAGLTVVTGLLVDTAPPRAGAIQTPQAERGSFRLGDRVIYVYVDSRGERQYAIRIVTTRDGGPSDVDDLRASIRDPERGVGPLALPLQRRNIGVYVGRTTPPFAGHWLISVSVRIGEFEEGRHSFQL